MNQWPPSDPRGGHTIRSATDNMSHTETLDCPCKPETRRQVGGGSVLVHRETRTVDAGAPDRLCSCGQWHLLP